MFSLNNSNLLRSGFELGKGDKLFQDIERDIIKVVFWEQCVTQSHIVSATRIPQQTVSRLLKSLTQHGVIMQTDTLIPNKKGKPGFGIALNPEYGFTFGLAILLDAISVAVMDFTGKVIYTHMQLMSDMSINNVLKSAQKLVDDISAEHNIASEKVLGMGVGISGFFSSMDGKMNTHHMLEEWSQVDIIDIVSKHFQLPTWVVNDATGAAAGEGVAGIGREYKNFVYMFVSAAFGGGIVNNGDVLRGTYGNAGELGDMLPPKLYAHPNLELLKRILKKNGVAVDSIYDLHDDFDPEWPGVEEWLFKVQDSFDLVATCCSALLDAEAIIIGGHIPKELAEKVIARTEVYAQFRRGAKRPMPKLVVSNINNFPVSIGAATLPFRELCL
ncbi:MULTISPECIES: ROK family transcriptional regulator [unclassified Pseudoalteromonas]|mgnify:FL=1|jgi:predicted NBD/HSP70 family sugar kinase|uniref:ROK family transcriptional regulator n=1 Tax=unclassified Pseudoalteromonas TaxID=194690 RepID=UPI0023590F2B|nr:MULTISPECIES: ROK family transcriptional regulator [unclassified Pseudoalteromonas]MDC9509854.1 ROK family transcriptional regulator [Pseudoalteromonas sp. Angola-4]|tara:strand:- start:509 stop:1666 length:1158 start_codon:yes stop_codon:yes gene_type:complete